MKQLFEELLPYVVQITQTARCLLLLAVVFKTVTGKQGVIAALLTHSERIVIVLFLDRSCLIHDQADTAQVVFDMITGSARINTALVKACTLESQRTAVTLINQTPVIFVTPAIRPDNRKLRTVGSIRISRE